MPTRLPPRKEPRVLALARGSTGLLWGVADPWELRGVGELRCDERFLALMLRRLIRREKPTAIVAADERLGVSVERSARASHIPFVQAPRPLPPRIVATALYPELPLFAPRRSLARVAILAIASVLCSSTPRRPYAPRRRRTAAHST